MARPGSTTARGYGAPHQKARANWTRQVNAGQCFCSRCGQPIQPGTPWDLDHTDDRQGYTGPAHRYCNRAAGGRKANHRRGTSTRW